MADDVVSIELVGGAYDGALLRVSSFSSQLNLESKFEEGWVQVWSYEKTKKTKGSKVIFEWNQKHQKICKKEED